MANAEIGINSIFDTSAIGTRSQVETSRLRPSVTVRLARSVVDMPGQVKLLLSENPSEGRMLMFLLLSDLVFILSWTLKTLVSPTAAATALMGPDVVIWLLVAVMFRTSLIYLLSGAITLGLRMSGRQVLARDTRVGVFWGVFVAAPFGLAISELAVIVNNVQHSVPMLGLEGMQLTPYWVGFVPLIWFVAKGVAAANRISNAVPLFGALSMASVIIAYVINSLA